MKKFIPFIALSMAATQATFAQTTNDTQAIQQVVKTMSQSWSSADGAGFASVFADQHDYIVWNGFYFREINPEMNAASHNGIFNSIYKDTDAHFTLDKVKFIREDLALIHVLGAISKKTEGRPQDPQVLFTAIVEKMEGAWKIISFHNLDLKVFTDEMIRKNAPMPPQVMYASWYAEAGK